jgi:hypothetical protein
MSDQNTKLLSPKYLVQLDIVPLEDRHVCSSHALLCVLACRRGRSLQGAHPRRASQGVNVASARRAWRILPLRQRIEETQWMVNWCCSFEHTARDMQGKRI